MKDRVLTITPERLHDLMRATGVPLIDVRSAAGVTRWCGMERLVALMPWNRAGKCPEEMPLRSG